MSTLHELRQGLGRAWDNLATGWQELWERAGQALTRFTPSRAAGQLQTADEQTALHGTRWALLAAEVRDDGDALTVKLEAPGMAAEDFEVHVQEDYLVVRGEKRVEREQTQGRYHIMERAYGRFERAIPLPAPVDEAGARARYRKGVLSINLPKQPQARSRRVDVQSG